MNEKPGNKDNECSRVQQSTEEYIRVQYSTIEYSRVQQNTVEYSIEYSRVH